MTLVPGATLGPYRILEQIGRGGMATVYKAFHSGLARHVAIKVLPAHLAEDPSFRERFRAEAQTVARLRHPNVLTIHDFGEEGDLSYLVLEYVDGGTLAEQVGKPLPVDYVVSMLGPVASALDYAHAREVVHRDVKPSNVLLAKDGTPVLSDFGLARMVGSLPRLTQTGSVVGTPEYMAPEQAQGEDATAPTDRYALAVIAYEMLTGSVPFHADTPLATLLAHLHKPLPLPRERNPQLSEAVEAVLLKGLAKHPGDRYATARDLVTALEAAGGAAVPAAPTAPVAAATKPALGAPRPSRALLAAGGALLMVGLAAVAIISARALLAPLPAPAAPTTAATPAATPGFAKGALIFRAALDGAGKDLRLPRYIEGSPSATDIRLSPGRIDLAVVEHTGRISTGAAFAMDARETYVAELDLSATPGSDVVFALVLRRDSGGKFSYRLRIFTLAEALELTHWDSDKRSGERLGTRVPVPGLQSGRTVAVAVRVEATRFTVFLDGKEMAQFTDERVRGASVPEIQISGERGAVTITGARFYELPTAAAPAATPAAPARAPARGALIAEAKLDGTPVDVRLPRADFGKPDASEIRFVPGAIELRMLKPDAGTGVAFNVPSRLTYVAELELTASPDADATVVFALRRGVGGDPSYFVHAYAKPQQEFMELIYYRNVPRASESLTPAIAIPGLRSGRVIRIAAVVEATRYTLFLDGKQVAQVSDTRISAPTIPDVGLFGNAGTVRIVGARFYELP